MKIVWREAAGSDVGRVRTGNEDAFRADAELGVFLVADGMGGHAAGEVASAVAADAVLRTLSAAAAGGSAPAGWSETMRDAFLDAHREIARHADEEPARRGMGTTLTALVLEGGGGMHVGHIGDSRLYRLRGGRLQQLTRDHTWVQAEVDAGRLEPSSLGTHPLSHILTRVLTADEPSVPDYLEERVAPGDLLLLCSDGLHNMVDDEGIIGLIDRENEPLEAIIDELIRATNAAGGVDNVTAIVIRVDAAT